MNFFLACLYFAAAARTAPLPVIDSDSNSNIRDGTHTLRLRQPTTISHRQLQPNAQAAFIPRVKSSTPLGTATDDYLNRDSCVSARFGSRALWTCRDTQFNQDGKPSMGIISSSASWTDFAADGSLPVVNNKLSMYGAHSDQPFFPLAPDSCAANAAGACGDSTRFAIWPDSAPLVASAPGAATVTGYTWIRKTHIGSDFSVQGAADPAASLYKLSFAPGQAHAASSGSQGGRDDALPTAALLDDAFWPEGALAYGNYGSVVRDGVAYLYGQSSAKVVGLARVPVAQIEDKAAYEYFVGGSWTRTQPRASDPGVDVANASAGGQGTYYFSSAWNRFVWIGQGGMSVAAQFLITTAPSPEGPWETPAQFFEGETGTFGMGAYSLAAHPALVQGDRQGREIVLSWTKNDLVAGSNVYSTPLVRVVWEDM